MPIKMAAEVDVSEVSSTFFQVYTGFLDQKLERYLWHLEDEPTKDVAAEIVEGFEPKEMEIARQALFVQVKAKVEERESKQVNEKGKAPDMARVKVMNRYADPWIMINRRIVNRLAMDICELYRCWIDKDRVFPYKILKRRTTAITDEVKMYASETKLITILETSEKSSVLSTKLNGEVSEGHTSMTSTGNDGKFHVLDFIDIMSYIDQRSKFNDLLSMELDSSNIHDLFGGDTESPNPQTTNKEHRTSEQRQPREVSDNQINKDASQAASPTVEGVSVIATLPRKDVFKQPTTTSEAKSETRGRDPGIPIGPPDKSEIKAGELNLSPVQPVKPTNTDPSQDSLLRDIQEAHDQVFTSSPLPAAALVKKKVGIDMATQTTPTMAPDVPVMRAEFCTQALYTQGALTDHERRLREHELWRDRSDRKVDSVDAEYHTQNKSLRAEMGTVIEELERMKNLMADMAEFVGNLDLSTLVTKPEEKKKSPAE